MPKPLRIAVPIDLGQPYKRHTEVFAGIHRYAEEKGDWRLIVDHWADRRLPSRADRPLPYDGIIGRVSALVARRAERLGMPVVNVWFSSKARAPSVFPDFSAAGRMCAEHLIARGFRYFGTLTHKAGRASEVMAAAFERSIREAGCDHLEPLAFQARGEKRLGLQALDMSDYREWSRALRDIDRWMDRWRLPIGLYVYDPSIARVIIQKCFDRDWHIPEDVAIIGGFNEEVQCERPSPSISSIELPYQRIGYEAARLLDDLLSEGRRRGGAKRRTAAPEAVSIVLPPVGIVPRHSTDIFSVDDPLVRSALRFIDENLTKPLNISNIADALNVSRRKLSGLFSEHLNRGIAAEIRRLRLERFKRQLISTDWSIEEIARRTGFASPRTMNDAFRGEVGCSPRDYRKEQSHKD